MKKYVKPVAKLVMMDSSAILAGSLGVKEKETHQMLSKQGMFYDLDNEDEEY